jgi:hypothetical protein
MEPMAAVVERRFLVLTLVQPEVAEVLKIQQHHHLPEELEETLLEVVICYWAESEVQDRMLFPAIPEQMDGVKLLQAQAEVVEEDHQA